MNSVSVITRAYDAEAPYIKSFIEHYIRIGCEHIHICVSHENSFSRLLEVVEGLDRVTVHFSKNDDSWKIQGIQNIALKHVTTSHIISVDVDEFLDVSSIDSLLEHDYVKLNWIIAPILQGEGCSRGAVVKGFKDGHGKYIIRKSICERLQEHDCILTKNVEFKEADCDLIHHTSRSFGDLFLKCSMNRIKYYGLAEKSEFEKGLLDSVELPFKFRLAAAYLRIANAGSASFTNYCYTDEVLEKDLISKCEFGEKLHEFRLAFDNYYSRIDLQLLVQRMLRNRKYLSWGRLPHAELANIADDSLLKELNPGKWILKCGLGSRVLRGVTSSFSNLRIKSGYFMGIF